MHHPNLASSPALSKMARTWVRVRARVGVGVRAGVGVGVGVRVRVGRYLAQSEGLGLAVDAALVQDLGALALPWDRLG